MTFPLFKQGKGIRVPKGFRDPGLQPLTCGAPVLKDKTVAWSTACPSSQYEVSLLFSFNKILTKITLGSITFHFGVPGFTLNKYAGLQASKWSVSGLHSKIFEAPGTPSLGPRCMYSIYSNDSVNKCNQCQTLEGVWLRLAQTNTNNN